MRKRLLFFKQFLQKPFSVGSAVPSTKFLAEELCRELPLKEKGPIVVEFGFGTGVISEQIIPQLVHPNHYVGFEVDEQFRHLLSHRFEGVRVIPDSARNVTKYLQPLAGEVGTVVSSLPFSTFSYEKSAEIIQGCAGILCPEGELRLFLYTHMLWLPKNRRVFSLIREFFDLKSRRRVLRNFPPATLFTFSRKKQG